MEQSLTGLTSLSGLTVGSPDYRHILLIAAEVDRWDGDGTVAGATPVLSVSIKLR
jgi:hypothetical protein